MEQDVKQQIEEFLSQRYGKQEETEAVDEDVNENEKEDEEVDVDAAEEEKDVESTEEEAEDTDEVGDEQDEEESEEEVDEESEDVSEQLNALRARIKELAKEAMQSGEIVVPEFKVDELLSDDIIEEARVDNDKFRELIVNVMKVGYANALALLKAETDKERKANQLYQKFYEENPDLKEYGEYVDFMAQKLAKMKKFKTVDSFLVTLAKDVRASLGLTKKANTTKSDKKTGKPALPKKTKARQEKKKLNPMEKEILELIS